MADARYISNRVKKQLYALSGNECANPLCNNKLVYPDDNAKDDQICHIEAASPDGPRYNRNQTDDERRDYNNLILLCHRCHDMIDNNPDIYTVEILKKWKREHEAKYKTDNKDKVFSFSVPDGLLPRDTEADNLYNSVITNHFFNLVGVGGSGKTSLAYLMMQKHESNFNEKAYVVVNNNIKDDFVEQINKTLRFEFDKGDDSFSVIIEYLRDNFKSELPNLLVLDINETSDNEKNDEIISSLLKNKDILSGWKILILSRENVDTRNRIDAHNLNDKEDVDFLKQMFLSKAGTRYNDFGNFDELFKTIFYNPLLAEQLGLYLNSDPELATINDIKKILYGESFKEEKMQGLSAVRHDEEIISFLKNLIKYNDLNDNEKNLLRHFVLWQAEYIGYDVLKDLLKGVFESEEDLKNALKSLSKRSILTTNNDKTLRYKLHGLLAESLREQIGFTKQDYSAYLSNIGNVIQSKFEHFLPLANCIGHSLCNTKYGITEDFTLLYECAKKFKDACLYSNSKMLYERCIEFMEELNQREPNNIKHINNLLMAYNGIANLHICHFSDFEKAINYYDKALEFENKILTLSTQPEDFNELTTTQFNYANTLKDHSNSPELAKKIYLKMIECDSIFIQSLKDAKYLNSIASAYNNLALLEKDHYHNFESAQGYYEKAINIHEHINTMSDNLELQYSSISTYCNYAKFQNKIFNKYDLAEEYFKKAIIIGEKLVSNSDNPKYQASLASAFNSVGQIQFQHLKKNDIAQINIEKAISIREKLSKLNIQHLIECIDSKCTLTTIFLANKQFTKAKLLIEEIKPQLEKCLKEKPNDPTLKCIIIGLSTNSFPNSINHSL